MKDILQIPYSTWKRVAQNNGWSTYHKDDGADDAWLWTGRKDVVFASSVKTDIDILDWQTNFPSSTLVQSQDDAIAQIIGLDNTFLQKLSPSGLPQVAPSLLEGSAEEFISCNWCDKTTWWSSSVEVTDENLSDSGDGLVWNSANTDWIDVKNGKITQEHMLHATHAPVIEVDGSEATESSPGTTDGDYQVNYATGVVTFNTNQSGNTVVAKSYRRMVDSVWTFAPKAGKKLRLLAVEIQFTTDVDLTDTAVFEIRGYAVAFIPGATTDDVSPNYVTSFPTGFKITLRERRYQTIMDYLNEAQRLYPVFEAMGGSGWRGLQNNVQLFRWPYAEEATRDLSHESGMEGRIYLMNNIKYGGDKAYVTVYARSEDE
jgi:hypothetical protein